jgi:hypothetical protein
VGETPFSLSIGPFFSYLFNMKNVKDLRAHAGFSPRDFEKELSSFSKFSSRLAGSVAVNESRQIWGYPRKMVCPFS